MIKTLTTILTVFLTLPAHAQTVLGIKDDVLYFKGMDNSQEYQLKQEGYIRERTVTADECGLITIRNSKAYPLKGDGNYHDIYFQENDYWYYWTDFTTDTVNYPKPKCKQIGGSFVLEGALWDAGDGTGNISFVVFPEALYLYHPALIKPFSQHRITWYDQWDEVRGNYVGIERTSKISVNECGIGRVSLRAFLKNAYGFAPNLYSWDVLSNGSNVITNFDPALSTIARTPLCRKGELFEPNSYQ